MEGKTSHRLKACQEEVLRRWETRAMEQVASATAVTNLALRDSLPLYLNHLSEALSENRKMDKRSVATHDAKAVRIGKLHGADRARSASYLLTEVIFEYHILREVIFEVLEVTDPLSQIERDIVLDSIEQAVNDAVVEFSDVHADIQQKFVSTLTHDLKTPISSAKLNAELIIRLPDSTPKSANHARKIVASLDRLNGMIHDLLDVSRLRAGEELALRFETCDLATIATEVAAEMTEIHGDRFVTEFDPTLPGYWSCDGVRRALENLLGNAVKYSPPDTPIQISAAKSAGMVRIEVHNEGAPISAEDQEFLFQQFRRAKNVNESPIRGWGIGLTLVKGVVDAHGGSVRVESAEGRKTTFIMELPIRSE